MSLDPKCKICRRAGKKLFLKGEKCFSPKCPMVKKPYPPGIKGKRRQGMLSEYGKELREKQKLKLWYNLRENQFKKYVKEVLEKTKRSSGKIENPSEMLIRELETRLDNVIFRLGLAASRFHARQLVSHGHFMVNKRSVNIPSFQVKKGDIIEVKKNKRNKAVFKDLALKLKNHQVPSWLSFNIEKFEAKVTGSPNLEEAAPPAEVSSVFEFYSK